MRRTALDVVSVGHQVGPSLIWCHKRAKAAFPVLSRWSPGLLMSGARHKQDNSKKAESPRRKLYEYRVSRKTNTPKLFQSGAWTINIREFLSLSIGTAHFFANIQTHTDLLNHCGFLHTHNTPTTMTWQGLH